MLLRALFLKRMLSRASAVCLAMGFVHCQAAPRTDSAQSSVSEEGLAELPGSTLAVNPLLRDKFDKRLAERDDWDTEVFAAGAATQLDELGKLLHDPASIDAASLTKLTGADYRSKALRPAPLVTTELESGLTVQRAAATDGTSEATFAGLDGLADALRELASAFGQSGALKAKFTIDGISREGESVLTSVIYHATSEANGLAQQNARWTCRWRPGEADALPRLEAELRRIRGWLRT